GASGFSSDAMLQNFAARTVFSAATQTSKEYKYNAIFSRIGYTYHRRYVVNLTGRRDASSRFGPGKKIGNFGAIGLAWIFSNEDFLKQVRLISFGKIRASYGSTGNDQLGDYKYLSTYTTYNLPYQGNVSITPTQLTNKLFSWERVNKFEIGLELGLLDNKLEVNANYYRNRTNNQLVQY